MSVYQYGLHVFNDIIHLVIKAENYMRNMSTIYMYIMIYHMQNNYCLEYISSGIVETITGKKVIIEYIKSTDSVSLVDGDVVLVAGSI